jgi:hypothetical protein
MDDAARTPLDPDLQDAGEQPAGDRPADDAAATPPFGSNIDPNYDPYRVAPAPGPHRHIRHKHKRKTHHAR